MSALDEKDANDGGSFSNTADEDLSGAVIFLNDLRKMAAGVGKFTVGKFRI